MADLLSDLREAAARGEIEPWKAALLGRWLAGEGNLERPGPSPEDLARILVDPQALTALKAAAEGPWDTLAAQARSLLAHERVGTALDAVGPP